MNDISIHFSYNTRQVGLDGVGKTTLLRQLRLGEEITTIPVIGFEKKIVSFLDFCSCFSVHNCYFGVMNWTILGSVLKRFNMIQCVSFCFLILFSFPLCFFQSFHQTSSYLVPQGIET